MKGIMDEKRMNLLEGQAWNRLQKNNHILSQAKIIDI